MKNENIRKEFYYFINDSEKMAYDIYFTKVSKFEEEFDCDLHEMNKSQVFKMLAEYKTISNVRPALSRTRKYFKWADENGYINGLNYMDAKVTPTKSVLQFMEEVGKAQTRYYITPDKFKEYTNKLMATDNGIYLTALMLALYEGISGKNFENLENLRAEEIRKSRVVKLHDGKSRFISKKLRNLLLESSEVRTMIGKRTFKIEHSKYPDSIWKTNRKNTSFANIVKFSFYNDNKIRDILKDDQLSPEVVYRSGLFNYMIDESKKRGYDLKSDMKNDIVIIKANEGAGVRIKSDARIRYGELLESYGTDISFLSFKRMFKDWVDYI